jgi:hypothetical protein
MRAARLASARAPGDAFKLRCEIREKLIDFLQRDVGAAERKLAMTVRGAPPRAEVKRLCALTRRP